MKRIIFTIAVLAGILAFTAPAMASVKAAPATDQVSFKLGVSCTVKPADYGRGLSLMPGHPLKISLSTKGNIVFTQTWVSDPAVTGYGWGAFTLAYKGHYLRVNGTHAWLGTVPQVYSMYAGYGDACGGPRAIHNGTGQTADPSEPSLGTSVWTASGKVLHLAPVTVDASNGEVTKPAQVWDWTDH